MFILLIAICSSFLSACGNDCDVVLTKTPTLNAEQVTSYQNESSEYTEITTEKSAVMQPETTDTFVPRNDYGKLFPYLGEIKHGGGYIGDFGVYGLCKADGTVVVKPIYTEVLYCDGYYLLLKSDFPRPSEGDGYDGQHFIIPENGSSVYAFKKDTVVYYDGNGIFTFAYVELLKSGYRNMIGKCDAAGKIVKKPVEDGSEDSPVFHNGIALVLDKNNSKTIYRFIDESNRTIKTVDEAFVVDSKHGIYAVRGSNGKYGVFSDLKQVLPFENDAINCGSTENRIVTFSNGYISVYDLDFEKQFEIYVGKEVTFFYLIGYDFLQLVKGNASFIIDKNGTKINKENIRYIESSDLYYSLNGENMDEYDVFDRDLKELYKVPNGWFLDEYNSFGKYILTGRAISDYDSEYRLVNVYTGETIKNVGYFYNVPNAFYVSTSNGQRKTLLSKKNMSKILTFDSFYSESMSSLGTIRFYDLNGTAYTVTLNGNVICKVSLKK